MYTVDILYRAHKYVVEKKEMDVSSYALLYMFSVSLCVLFVQFVGMHLTMVC